MVCALVLPLGLLASVATMWARRYWLFWGPIVLLALYTGYAGMQWSRERQADEVILGGSSLDG